ncbi:hypothetical protein MSHI_33970 [Mycobacterium shinjukuense]|uniref:Uncharacterized protein n=1 Tax=Mycobacterium shinjukuense TaxID=398694 RepID=A0A7I7MTB8_9MYCO|nr:hypothetical protein MSHI_33970 [Mycobacterium shinjukuense]
MCGPGLEPPVELVDPVAQHGQLVRALDCLGRVTVIADHAAVIFDLDLQPVMPLPEPGQFGGEVLARRGGKPW